MLGEEDFLVELRVDAEVDELLSEVEAAADELKTHVLGKLRKPPSNIGYKCKGCEYRVDGQQSGFNECWGQLARKNPHIFSLYRVDAIKDGPNRLVDVLIQQGRAGLFDIPAESCTTAYGTRQLIQLEHMRSGTPWMDPELPRMMKAFPRPLHFIDFEAARLAVPYHAHMRPFELIPFQWSCHTLDADDRLTHREFINLEPKLPSLDFATSLRAAIPDGTVLIWSPYERTCLREVAIQIESYHPGHSDLVCWLREVADDTNRVRDQMKMTLDYYFHPHMEGSVSIKKVLPAIWNADAELRARPEFAEYAAAGAGSPYKTLPKEEILDEADMVEEGTGAIRAYEAMLFGQGSQNPEFRDARKRLLLQYCKLDTAAMVMIWRHWEMFATRSF